MLPLRLALVVTRIELSVPVAAAVEVMSRLLPARIVKVPAVALHSLPTAP
jgi:hypothetical protein